MLKVLTERRVLIINLKLDKKNQLQVHWYIATDHE